MKFTVVHYDLEGKTVAAYLHTEDFDEARRSLKAANGEIYIRVTDIEEFQAAEVSKGLIREMQVAETLAFDTPDTKDTINDRHFQVITTHLEGGEVSDSQLWLAVGYFLYGSGISKPRPWKTSEQLEQLYKDTDR